MSASASAQDAATALRAKQAPLKSQYRDDPASALVTLSCSGSLSDSSTALTCSLGSGSARAAERIAGMHAAAGGLAGAGTGTADIDVSRQQLCSGDMLLESLVACFGVTLRAVATSLQVELRGGTVTAEGTLDFRGTLGVKDAHGGAVGVGFREVRLVVRLDVDVDEDGEEEHNEEGKVERLIRLSERYCVVLQTLRQGVHIETKIGHVGKSVPDARKDSVIAEGEKADEQRHSGHSVGGAKPDDEEVLRLN